MRALVTGGSGYIGGRLLSRLLDEGHEVTALVRGVAAPQLDPRASVARIEGPTSLADIVEQAAPEVVFHVASAVVIEHSPDEIADIIHANVTFPTLLLEAMTVRAAVPGSRPSPVLQGHIAAQGAALALPGGSVLGLGLLAWVLRRSGIALPVVLTGILAASLVEMAITSVLVPLLGAGSYLLGSALTPAGTLAAG